MQYAQANVPQAWAAGSIGHLLKAILGLDGDAPHGKLLVAPALPKWLPEVTLRGIAVGAASVDVRFFREGETSRWEMLGGSGDALVEERAILKTRVTSHIAARTRVEPKGIEPSTSCMPCRRSPK